LRSKRVLMLLLLVLVMGLHVSPTRMTRAGASIIRVPNDFPTIQEAINAAQNGSTILVETGVYYEHLTLNKSLTLLGANKEDTVVDGSNSDNVIAVTSGNVVVDGFTIRNSSTELAGILLYHSTGSVVTDNVVTLNGWAGIELDGSSNNIVSDNIISSTGSYTGGGGLAWGVGIMLSSSANNTLSDNVITDSLEAGVLLDSSYNNSIFRNTMENNLPGVMVHFSGKNTFFGNNIRNSVWQAGVQGPDNDTWAISGRGNHWDDYTGLDDGSGGRVAGDGVGDTNLPWHGVDNYPLIEPVNPVPIFWNNTIFPTSFVGNSTVYALRFNQASKEIAFNVAGPTNTTGYFNMSIPKSLLSGSWTILLDGATVTSEATITENQTHTTIYLNYSQNTHSVQVIGTKVIPEFPTSIPFVLLILLSAPPTILIVKKRKRNKT
jgi:parallel beta-helix repeat protein